MKEAKGKFCGDFKPPKTPFQSQPFFGKHARSGGRATERGLDDDGDDASRPRPPTRPTGRPRTRTSDADGRRPDAGTGGDDETGTGGGNGNGGTAFDPGRRRQQRQPTAGRRSRRHAGAAGVAPQAGRLV